NPVDLGADFRHQRSLVIRQIESAEACRDTINEQLCSRIGEHGASCQSLRDGWAIKRKQPEYVLVFGSERFSAGGQDVEFGTLSNQAFGERSERVQHMLATIEHDKQALRAQEGDQTRCWILHADGQSKR